MSLRPVPVEAEEDAADQTEVGDELRSPVGTLVDSEG